MPSERAITPAKPMCQQVFRPVLGYETLYEVSDTGRVRSLRSARFIAVSTNGAGYPVVHLSAGGVRRTRPVHTLILEAFVSPRPPGMVAAHLDGVRQRSALSNLKWVTPAENQAHRKRHGTDVRGAKHPRAVLTEHAVAIIKLMAARGISQRECGKRFGVHASTIGSIFNGRTWRQVAEDLAPVDRQSAQRPDTCAASSSSSAARVEPEQLGTRATATVVAAAAAA
jgi:hypothetical protein